MASLDYLEFKFRVRPIQPASDILIAQLAEIGFESFVETDEGVNGYVQKKAFDENHLEQIQILGSDEFDITFNTAEIEKINWNETWEKSFNPIVVDEKCCVRAPFHESNKCDYEIVIEPKMSFGTGHHETTYMMIQHLLNLDFEEKSVLDMGCGTAVLAILAEMKMARKVDAIDIDNWCYLNSIENIERNNCRRISVFEGSVELITNNTYDIIIANINKNVLLNDIENYARALSKGGILLLSGFYKNDIEDIENECNKHMLKLSETLERNNWVSLKFIN